MLGLFRSVVLVAATVTVGLVAGLFYSYAYSVMSGWPGRRPDVRLAMQRINTAILNGWFFACFLGALALTVLAAVLHLVPKTIDSCCPGSWPRPSCTGRRSSSPQPSTCRSTISVGGRRRIRTRSPTWHGRSRRFETRWVRWNIVRTVTSTAAFGCFTWALVLYGRIATPGWS